MDFFVILEFLLFLILFFVVMRSLTGCLRSFQLFTHNGQLMFLLFNIFFLCAGIHVVFGDTWVNSIVSGLAIGFGLALQPILKHIVNGFILDGTRIKCMHTKGWKVKIKDVTGEIYTIGLIHTWIRTDEGDLVMINNDMLDNEYLRLVKVKETTQPGPETFSVEPKYKYSKLVNF